jgi:hypothetical protein
MKKAILLIALISCFNFSKAQNLVPNGGFEIYSSLPTTYGQIGLCSGWNNCSGGGDAEYYNTNSTASINFFGPRPPHSGSGMAGLCTYHSAIAPLREYISVMLTQQLISGTVYRVSFFLTSGINGGYTESTDQFGIALTPNQLMQTGTQNIVVTGQPEITTFICDSTWQEFDLNYTATGGEHYLTIGNFKDDLSTNHQFCHSGSVTAAYYFIDDVSVEVLPTGISEYIHADKFSVYPSSFTSNLTIQLPEPGTYSVIINNYLGQAVFSQIITGESGATLDLSSLERGFYFLSLHADDKKYTAKIIKQD